MPKSAIPDSDLDCSYCGISDTSGTEWYAECRYDPFEGSVSRWGCHQTEPFVTASYQYPTGYWVTDYVTNAHCLKKTFVTNGTYLYPPTGCTGTPRVVLVKPRILLDKPGHCT